MQSRENSKKSLLVRYNGVWTFCFSSTSMINSFSAYNSSRTLDQELTHDAQTKHYHCESYSDSRSH